MSERQILDALIYSDIKNNIIGSDLNKITARISTVPNSNELEHLDDILKDTVIKRACCINHGRQGNETLENYIVDVRIPIPKDFDFSKVNETKAKLYKKFGYIDKSVYVPKSICENYDNGNYNYNNNKCQDFMYLYCENSKKFYKDEITKLGGSPSDDEFYYYKPECACYADQPSYITGSVPPTCYAPGCDPNNNRVFQDTNSRKGCSVTICQTNLNTSGLEAGGSVSINSKVSQACGNQLNQDVPVDETYPEPDKNKEAVEPIEPTIKPKPITPSTDNTTNDTTTNDSNIKELDKKKLSIVIAISSCCIFLFIILLIILMMSRKK